MTSRLSEATLSSLASDVVKPAYDRTKLKTGVVHLGIGAFHRAHQAAVFDDMASAGDLGWGIKGASLRSAGVRDDMAPQDGLYTLAVREGAKEDLRIVGCVRQVLVAPEKPVALVEALAHPDVQLVTLTVTEKGYKLDPVSGALLEGDPDVEADSRSLQAPRTAPGFIVAALERRRTAGLSPFTAMSCDNLPHNGGRLRDAVIALARRHDPDLASWIEDEGAFPQTMVDRIVPATTPHDVEALEHRIGVEDRAMVKTEPFLQWVIEDSFAGTRPEFRTRGVQLTRDVAPWEDAKLRLLNGAHSGIAYLGGLARISFVHDFVADPDARRFVEALWDEAQPTLALPQELDPLAYRRELMQRFANQALQHRTVQIAMDGSQKLPQRLLAPIAIRLRRGQPIEALSLAVAAWMRWQGGEDDEGRAFTVDDPLAATTRRLMDAHRSAADRVSALLSITQIFPAELAGNGRFKDVLTRQLAKLSECGALETVRNFAAQQETTA